MRGTYIGPLAHLKGKTALLRWATHGCFVAQFDDVQLSKKPEVRYSFCLNDRSKHDIDPPYDALGFGWHAFPESDFEVTDVNARG